MAATLAQLFGDSNAAFLQSIGFVDQQIDDGTVIVDTHGGEQQRVRPNEDGFYESLQDRLNRAFARDASGQLVHGTAGFDRERQDWNAGTDEHGISWIRVDHSPDALRADSEYAAVLDRFNPQFWGKYDPVKGWLQPAAIAQAIAPITDKKHQSWADWLPIIFGVVATAGVALYAAPAIAAEAAAVGVTAGEAGAGSIAGSVITTDFALVPAGSNLGLGGVGTAGVGLQVPATLGGTASGLGLASTGATTALLTPELIAAAGNYTFNGLTAAQAAEAAAASGISAPAASSGSWWQELTQRASAPSTGTGGSAGTFDAGSALGTASKLVGTAGTLGSLYQKLTGGSDGTPKVPAAATNTTPKTITGARISGGYLALALITGAGVVLFALTKGKK